MTRPHAVARVLLTRSFTALIRLPPSARLAYPSAVKVLGIDPGTAACGYGIVHVRGGRVTALASGCWTTGARERPELRLRVIFEGVQALIAAHAPDAVAIEESFVGADARIALSVGQARGAVMVAAATAGVECTEYAPTRVKQSVCGHGHADKGQVQRMVKMLLSLPGDPADLARGRRPRRRDLPRADAAARADGVVIARLRGTPAGRSADGLVLDVNGVGYLDRRHAGRPQPRRGRGRDLRRDVPPRARGRAAALRVRRRRGAPALRPAAHRQRRRPQGRARRRLGLAGVRAAAGDRDGGSRAVPGHPGDREADRGAHRARAEGEGLAHGRRCRGVRGRGDAHAPRRQGRARRARLHGARGGAATPATSTPSCRPPSACGWRFAPADVRLLPRRQG